MTIASISFPTGGLLVLASIARTLGVRCAAGQWVGFFVSPGLPLVL